MCERMPRFLDCDSVSCRMLCNHHCAVRDLIMYDPAPRRDQIGDGSINEVMAERIRDQTEEGDTLTMIYHPLASGTDRWDLVDKDGKVILGSLDDEDLLDYAKRDSVKVIIEEESEDA